MNNHMNITENINFNSYQRSFLHNDAIEAEGLRFSPSSINIFSDEVYNSPLHQMSGLSMWEMSSLQNYMQASD